MEGIFLSNDQKHRIDISDEERDFLADILVKAGPVLIPENSPRYELLKKLLSSDELSAEREFKLTTEIKRTSQLTFAKSVSVETIIKTVINQFPGVNHEDLLETGTKRELNRARHICMLLIAALVEPRPSYKEIAHLVGRKDHTTVISAISTISEDIAKKPHIREEVEKILDILSYKFEDVFGAV